MQPENDLTTTWTQMARTALHGVRVWRAAVRRSAVAESDLGLTAVDAAVLSLLLDLADLDTVVCADERLRKILAEVWAEQGPPSSERRLLAAPAGERHLRLTRLGEVGGSGDTPVVEVVHGLGQGIALSEVPSDGRAAVLRPLASTAPALWQCGLALVGRGEGADGDLIDRLRQSMRGEWIDPLVLYERVQQLTITLKGLGHAEAVDADAELDRVAELEKELASLRKTALVSQHLLRMQAADGDGGVP